MSPPSPTRSAILRVFWAAAAILATLALVGCGATRPQVPSDGTSTATTASAPVLPGTGRPQVMIGDKNFTEQFLLGELYSQALTAEGFSVALNPNIGPTDVTIQALESGRLDMYPEYLDIWNTAVAGYTRTFRTPSGAYQAAQRYALAHGLELLAATPFSDTGAIGVTDAYASQNSLATIGDLRRMASGLTLGGPATASGQPVPELLNVEQAYGFMPAAFQALEVGDQYPALDQGSVQAADVSTTDGELASGNYTLLKDPRHVFGWGNAIPVVPAKVLTAEGPAFAATIDSVSALLTTAVMRRLNAAVDIAHMDPASVAKEFLVTHGLVPPSQG